jgi:hypothetical protein
VENNSDRFGLPILPRRPLDNYPGPGEYNVVPRLADEGGALYMAKGGMIGMDEKRVLPGVREKGVPGPAYYNTKG